MKLKHINQYIHKSKRDLAPKFHQLFNQNSPPFQIPTAKELILEKLIWFKWFEKEYNDLCVPFSEDDESQ